MDRATNDRLSISYRADDPSKGPRVPAVAWPLALAGAICTGVGLFAASGMDSRRFALYAIDHELVGIIAMLLVVYAGQPLCFAALLIVRRPWSREHAPCRLTHPVPLLAILTLSLAPLLGLGLAVIGQAPQLAGACGCGPVLLVLGLLIWFGGPPTPNEVRRHVD